MNILRRPTGVRAIGVQLPGRDECFGSAVLVVRAVTVLLMVNECGEPVRNLSIRLTSVACHK